MLWAGFGTNIIIVLYVNTKGSGSVSSEPLWMCSRLKGSGSVEECLTRD